MKTYNKIVIASLMFEKAHELFSSFKEDIDLVSSILLSGAVIGIISPLLKEQGRIPMQDVLAQAANIMPTEGETHHVGLFRELYNSLKHAGNHRQKLSASADLTIITDLAREAGRMLDTARADFRQVELEGQTRDDISESFIALLRSGHEYI